MKLSKKQETEVRQVYEVYWDSLLKVDVKTYASVLDKDFRLIGTTEAEVFFNKKEATKFLEATADQVAGNIEIRNRIIKVEPVDGLILITEVADAYVLIEGEWTFYSRVRISSMLQKKEEGWKFIHQHCSLPDTRAEEGESFALEKIKTENLELRDAVKRRTIELEHKNRELEIEGSLERVRAQALSMNKPDDLPGICEILFAELRALGFDELRNAMINIFDDDKSSFLNYDYSDDAGKNVIHFFYNTHPVIENQVKMIRSSRDAFSETSFSGKELEEWKEFRRRKGERDDPRLENISALYYYFYSIGIGAIGISTFCSITEEKLNVLKRFRNVFDFAYRRYMDVAQAEAQAREAQIEAALEKVRSRTMGMQKSEELKKVIQVVYEQFVHLNILIEHTGFIMDYKARDDMNIWLADQHEVPSQVTIPYFDSAHWNSFNEAKEKGMDFFANNLTFEEKNRFYQELFKLIPGLPDETKEYYFSCPGVAISTVLLENVGLYIENFSGISYSDEENATLMRFGKVFQQTYTRFLDLQKAEAQAREAQIEASLEKVRGRAMAMHNSNDLSATASMVFTELRKLGIHPIRSGVGLLMKEQYKVLLYAATASSESHELSLAGGIDMSSHPCLKMQYESCTKKENYFPVLNGEELKSYYKELAAQISVPPLTEEQFKHEQYGYYFPFSEGYFYAWTEQPYSENEINILNRFKSILELTFRRYLDLKKAEAQAREAQIEASLERVRAKAMAMHNSNDLSSAASVVFSELKKLGIITIRSGISLQNKENRKNLLYSATGSAEEESISLKGWALLDDHPVLSEIYNYWLRDEDYFPILKGEILKSYYEKIKLSFVVPPEQAEDYEQHGYFISFTHGMFYGWAEKKFNEDEKKVLKRFASVVDLTFKRYFDLEKAEAQAREAKIEAALERVRSKAMAMHKSDDLNTAVAIVFEELDKLNLGMLRCGIGILSKEKRSADVFTTTIADHGRVVQVTGDESMDIHPLLQGAFDAWLRQGDFSYVLEGDDMSDYYRAVRATNFQLPESQIMVEHPKELQQYYYAATFQSGALFAFRQTDFPEEAKAVIKRFAGVFNLTYKRFLDIQNAEALAYKAQIEEQKLKEEKKRSDALLLNILPEEIANELKQFGKSYARKHEQVTVLFADIKGFSSIAESLSADELVTQLDECFRAFDKIVEKHGLEKIKTVGDAYVCACGLPKPVHDNAVKTVAAALDMIEFIKGFGMTKKIQNLPAFEFRVGIHTGPVVTGVVGLKKFTYDIWGDAVNLAARMEQHGEAGKINVSGNTYLLIKDKFTCTHRGKIEAKNKGEVDMYFVEQPN